MKRIAITLAAALLGTGCIVDSNDHHYGTGDVVIYWDFVRNAPAQPGGAVLYDADLQGAAGYTGACAQSAVEVVEVRSDAGVQTFSCLYQGVQGVTLGGEPEGTGTYTITGYRGNDAVYRTTVDLDVYRDTETRYTVDLPAVSAPVELYAYLYPGGGQTYALSCAEAGYPTLVFNLYDSYGTLVDGGTVACQGNTAAAPLFFYGEPLDLDDYALDVFTPSGATFAYGACPADTDFSHWGTQVGAQGVPVSVFNPPPASCP